MRYNITCHKIVNFLFFLGIVLFVGCGGSGGGSSSSSTLETQNETVAESENNLSSEDSIARLIENLGVNVMMATYVELDEKAEELQNAVEALKEKKTQANLDLARNKWKAARSFWTQSEAFFLGPVVYDELGEQLDSWPFDVNELEQILAESDSFSIFFILSLDRSLSGFHVMEYLLYGDDKEGNVKSLDRFTDSEIAYLAIVSRIVKGTTLEIKSDWDSPTGYSDPYVTNFMKIENNFSQTYQLWTLVNAMIELVAEMADIQLAKPLSDSPVNADPTLIESRFSGNTLNELQDNIRGVLSLYTGDFGEQTGPGMDEFVAEYGSSGASDRVQETLENTLQVISAIGDEQNPLKTMIDDSQGRVRIQAAIESLKTLQQTLETEVLSLFACGKFNQLNLDSPLCAQFEVETDVESLESDNSVAEDENQVLRATDFECILNWTKVRNFRITNKWGNLEETLTVANSPAGKRYPPGTIIQLLPSEAMFKRTEGWNPQTNDWEFFLLEPSQAGTQIISRGTVEVFNQRGENCFACHSQAATQWDFTCETGHGCDNSPLEKEELNALQNNDPRCDRSI